MANSIALPRGGRILENQACPDCGSQSFFHNRERGELVCKECSFVLDEALIDFGSEVRRFDDDGAGSDDGDSRTGAPFDPRIVNNLATTIGNASDFAKLNSRTRAFVSRLKKRQSWASTSFEQNLGTAMASIRLVSSKLSLPERVEKEAAVLYRQAALKGLAMKRSIENLSVAALFIACKMQGIPRAMKEFSEASKCELKVLGKCFKLILRELNLKLAPLSPVDYIAKFASALKLTPKTQSRAVKLVQEMERKNFTSGLSPLSISASVIYISCQIERERKTQAQIAEATGITETTLRNRCKDLVPKLGIKLPPR